MLMIDQVNSIEICYQKIHEFIIIMFEHYYILISKFTKIDN